MYLPVSAAPGVLLSVCAKWSLTESFHVIVSDPGRWALTHFHKPTRLTIPPLFTSAAMPMHSSTHIVGRVKGGLFHECGKWRWWQMTGRNNILKKGRKSSFPYSLISQAVISVAEGEAEQVRERICHFLASVMTDCCATGALITIKRAVSHTLFLLLCLLSTAKGQATCTDRNTHTHTPTCTGERL